MCIACAFRDGRGAFSTPVPPDEVIARVLWVQENELIPKHLGCLQGAGGVSCSIHVMAHGVIVISVGKVVVGKS